MEEYFIGLDYGTSKITAAVAKKDCRVIGKLIVPTQNEHLVESALDAVEELTLKANLKPADILAFGLATPWLMVTSTQRVLGDHIQEELQKKYKKPAEFDTDSNVALYGEYKLGAGRAYQNILYLSVSTGIAAGIINKGNLYHGSRGRAGFAGHISLDPNGPQCACGLKGCFHMLASGTAVVKRTLAKVKALDSDEAIIRLKLAQELNSDFRALTAELIYKLAAAEDPFCMAIVRENAEIIGRGIASLINLLDPEVVIVGGGLTQAGDTFFKPLQEFLKNQMFAKDVPVVPAELGADSTVVGALALIAERFNQ